MSIYFESHWLFSEHISKNSCTLMAQDESSDLVRCDQSMCNILALSSLCVALALPIK